MAKEPPQTIADMRRKAIVTDKEIATAVEAYLADSKAWPFEFASGNTFNSVTAFERLEPCIGCALH